jgi:hypothetical protein
VVVVVGRSVLEAELIVLEEVVVVVVEEEEEEEEDVLVLVGLVEYGSSYLSFVGSAT